MYTITLLFACLLCVGSARRVQTTKDEVTSDAGVQESMQEAQQAMKEMLANAPSKELVERAAEQLEAFKEDLRADPNLLDELDAAVAEVKEALRPAAEANPTTSLASLMLAASGAAPGTLGNRAATSRYADARMGASNAWEAMKLPTLPRTSKNPPASLKELANKLNPVVGYFDPLNLGSDDFWGWGNEATVGFLRHSEIKHGRVAMAAFVGYVAQSNGLHWPWKLTGSISFEDIAKAGSPPEQWDALPFNSKIQIILFIGFLEFWSENSAVLEKEGLKHYMKGGEPGKFPSFTEVPHSVPINNLWDPLDTMRNKPMTPEMRAALDKSLLAEINNGRLAMLGIMGFLAEQKVPGAVPVIKQFIGELKPYTGNLMDPFGEGWAR